MKKSRLQARKLGIKPKSKTKKPPFLRLIVFAFLLFIFVLIAAYFLLPRSWDGKSKFVSVSQTQSGDAIIQIIDPVNSLVTNIKVPADTLVEAANQLGSWKLGSITKLGIDKNAGSDFLKNTIIKSFKFPVDSGDNLSIVDKVRIKLFLLTAANTGDSNLNLKDTDYLVRSKLVDGSLGWKIAETMPTNVAIFFTENFG